MSEATRKSDRVAFSRGLPGHLVAVDGTWHRKCTLLDISDTGARLLVEESFDGLNLKEFFLQLSTVGLVFRRCGLVRVNGSEIGVSFAAEPANRKQKRSSAAAGS
jgi:hypothetical protein